MNSHRANVPGTHRRAVAKATAKRWDAGESKADRSKPLTKAQRVKIAAARPVPPRQSQADSDAIAAYLARVA